MQKSERFMNEEELAILKADIEKELAELRTERERLFEEGPPLTVAGGETLNRKISVVAEELAFVKAEKRRLKFASLTQAEQFEASQKEDRILKEIEHLKEEINVLQKQYERCLTIEEEIATLRTENRLLREMNRLKDEIEY
jgi:hypothetical protein